MFSRNRSVICMFGKYMQNNLPLTISPINYPCDTYQQVRNINKHWNPKFKKERKEKFIKIDLSNHGTSFNSNITEEKMRSILKREGILPQREWNERPICYHSMPVIFESYVIPDGDGKYSNTTTEIAKQKFKFFQKKGKSYMAVRTIKSYEPNFKINLFEQEALDIYKKAHETLATKDQDELVRYVTETGQNHMMDNMKDKTIHWKFLKSLEPARVVHARTTYLATKQNIYAQITVRFHMQQMLCIYDRFGRVMHGSEILAKDVLDYIVFEKQLSNEYGVWRVHGKITPSWMQPEEVAGKTYVLPKEKSEEVDSLAKAVNKEYRNAAYNMKI